MAKKLTKRMQNLINKVDCKKIYDITTASATIKSLASAKFDETVEVALSLGVDPRHADQMIRGAVVLPNGTGKKVRVAVFAKGAKADEAKAAGADVVGDEDLAEQIKNGDLNFDMDYENIIKPMARYNEIINVDKNNAVNLGVSKVYAF